MKVVFVLSCALAGCVAGSLSARVAAWLIRRDPVAATGGVVTGTRRSSMLASVTTGALFASAGLRFGPQPVLPAYCSFFAFLVVVSLVDVEVHRIPKRAVYVVLATSIPFLAAASLAHHQEAALLRAILPGFTSFILFAGLHLARPKAMGFGDARLAGLVGTYLGWLGTATALRGFTLSFLLAGGLVVVLLGTGHLTWRNRVPLAPFLAAGAVLAFL